MKTMKKFMSIVLSLLMIVSIIPMSSITVCAVEESRTDYDMSIGVLLESVESHGVVKNEIDLLDYDGGFAVYPDETTTITYQIAVKQQTTAQNVVIEQVAIYYDANLTVIDTTYDIENLSYVNIGGKCYKKAVIRDICLPNDGSYAGRAEIMISLESPLGYLGIFNDFYCEIYSGDSKYTDTDSVPGNALKSNEFDIEEDDSDAFTNPYNLQAAPYGLKYEINDEKVYITGFIGNKSVECLYIPSEINCMPVFQINSDAFLDSTGLFKKVFIPSSVTNILSGAFRHSDWSPDTQNISSVEDVIISEGVKWIGSQILYNCADVHKVYFPSTVSYISAPNFEGQKFYGSSLSCGLYLFCELPNPSLEEIHTISGSYADTYFKNIKNSEGSNTFSHLVVNSEKIFTVNYVHSYNGGNWNVVETRPHKSGENIDLSLQSHCDSRRFVGWNTDPNATVGLNSLQMENGDVTLYAIYDTYNLGEESYSFGNYSKCNCSNNGWGHCFGMSMTSAGYYNNILDITNVGGNTTDDVYGLSLNSTVQKPVCYYQKIQGGYAKGAIVAGGRMYLGEKPDISSDWQEVINYVKNHDYDNTGALQIGFKDGSDGHAVNFLRYEVVDSQERIYAYDNNFPNIETYFYKDSDGNMYQGPYPYRTFSGAIDCIALRDVNKYFELTQYYDATRYIYGDTNSISISGSIVHLMECGDASYAMFEIPEGADQVVITPLIDNASFDYCNKEYSFGNIDDETVGVFKLATEDEGATTESNLIITKSASVTIQNPSTTTIRKKDGIILRANVEGTAPAGSYVVWTASNNKFTTSTVDEDSLKIVSNKNGYTTFTAILYDGDGNVLASDSIEMRSKAGFFDIIASWFRKATTYQS